MLGTGAMGSRIARRLLAAGHDVTVWNRTAERAEPLAGAGAVVAATPAEAAASADHVITVLADPPALVAVLAALRNGLRPGQTLIERSTVGPTAVGDVLARVPPGVEVVDAPVLGSIGEVDAGTLQIFVGGTPEAVAASTPLLEVLGTPHHVGPTGAGAAAKLVANATLLGTLALLGEVVALADGLGLGRDAAFDVLATTPLAAQAERRRPVIDGTPPPLRFRLALAAKDAGLIVEAAGAAGVEAKVLAATTAWLRSAVRAGTGDLDYSAVLRHIIGPA